jgi:hypothetical protein
MSETKPINKNSLELLQIKQARKNQIAQQYNKALKDFVDTLKQAMIESGIPENQVKEWEIGQDGKTFVRAQKPQKLTLKIPKGEKK